MKIFALVIIIVSSCLADDVYLKTGYVFRNVIVKDTVDRYVTIQTSDRTRRIIIEQIFRIVNRPFQESIPTVFEVFEESLAEMYNKQSFEKAIEDQIRRDSMGISQKTNEFIVKYEYSNINFLPITLISIILAYDNFDQAGRLSDLIDQNEQLQQSIPPNARLDLSVYKKERSKRVVFGVAFSAISIINAVYSFKKVAVRANTDGITLSYNF